MSNEFSNLRCFAEINLDALIKNYHTALSFLNNGARLICVLKADAYGLGAAVVAKVLTNEGADYFAAACFSEALTIKNAAPNADVMVLGLVNAAEAREAIKRGITLTVYSEDCAKMVLAASEELQLTALVQIKVDTGLHRLGFDPDDAHKAAIFAKHEFIKVVGVYTHLALRDAASDDKQFMLLDRFDSGLRAEGIAGYMLHACDTIGMVRYPDKHMNAVRTGAWLFGVCPYSYVHPELCLPTVAFKTLISQLHRVPSGECIGYDDEHPLTRDSIVATLSVGYVDGYPRLNNEGFVLVRGQKAKVLGLVCMDQMMVDVTDIEGAAEGDVVTLIDGELYDGELSVNSYAKIGKLNHNEALCRIGQRVPRIYTYHAEQL